MRATIDADAKKQWGGKKSDIAYCCTKDMTAAKRKSIGELERRQGYPAAAWGDYTLESYWGV